MDCYTANWDPLGEAAYYRKLDLYSMGWNLKEDLQDCLVAAAPYGGPIALLKNRKEKSPSSRPPLEIYTASGVLLASILWKNSPVVHLGWTTSEDLLCVQEDGSVLVYSIFCEFKKCFSMGNEVLQNRVLEAKVFHTEYGTGVAILTGAHRFTMTTNVADLKLRRLPEVPGLQKPPSCWTVLCQDRVTIVLLAVGQDLYLLDNTTCSLVTLPGLSPNAGSYLRMAVSFNYRFLALFTDTGYLWMGRSHLKEKLGEFSCEFRNPPKQMAWCTRSHSKQRAVVLAWDRRLVVAGNGDQCIQYPLDEDTYLVPELDGVRIFSRSTHEFLHEIPEASQEIFRIASMAPGALLLEAQKEYEKESQKADEYLREIKDQNLLPEAVRQCIEAASYEQEPEIQKSLLRAASFGKCFVDKFTPESFVETCRDLRVLNAIRDYQIGIPLSFDQYRQLTTEVLLDRLVLRRLYPVAIKICEYLRLSEFQGISRILAHWACYKVQQKDKSDEEVAQAINQKLGDTPGISYSEIAARAYECGRTELAIKLLEYEPRSGKQVPLLLKMKRSQLALSKAIESGDTDLVYTVILHLKNELNRGAFFMTLQNQPVAMSLYRQFCKHQELDTLKDLYNQDDDHQELGNFHVRSSYVNEKRIEGRVASLQNAVDEYYKAKNEFAAKATEDQIKLLRIQRRLQDDFDKPYLDYSLHDTVYNLILEGNHKRAEQLYRDFKIPDKRFWWLKINALAEQGDWEEMEKFSKSKKSPIGYLPFVEICMKHHNRHEARKFAPRVAPEQRVKAFLLVGDLNQAADAAIERKNETEMSLVLSKCNDTAVAAKINHAKAQLGKK
ncbi:vacuolar protein sorting-associated protein 16 homolog [Anolis carolinensis]|uniref:vacuolar protein sorting-associated protein 16 homolog n=1 Tax=Anolis carolinensis TaxID=28377 RepID=UPI0007DB7DE4|nr:PREDICTED: vacuolar protein sorting-associated protein 16 homolog [Anolis carolinensis]|eukprot:XP_016853960.1 PREDICTED: vacuolar protein sorting-associated protein 16 homolog [Anolis carolinensis]